MKKMKIYFYGEIYNIRNSYDIYKKETESGEEKIYEYNNKTKKYETSIKKLKKNTKSYHISYHYTSIILYIYIILFKLEILFLMMCVCFSLVILHLSL